eukprot:5297475-Prymnesium_polylepis.2
MGHRALLRVRYSARARTGVDNVLRKQADRNSRLLPIEFKAARPWLRAARGGPSACALHCPTPRESLSR